MMIIKNYISLKKKFVGAIVHENHPSLFVAPLRIKTYLALLLSHVPTP